MTSTEIKKIIEAELNTYKYEAPEPETTLGEPWSEADVMSYIPKLKAALVEPYLQNILVSESEGIKNYWVIAVEDIYYQWYDPTNEEYGLATESKNNHHLISIGVEGDLVGVYCAM
jgi:hypothetical protein